MANPILDEVFLSCLMSVEAHESLSVRFLPSDVGEVVLLWMGLRKRVLMGLISPFIISYGS